MNSVELYRMLSAEVGLATGWREVAHQPVKDRAAADTSAE